MLFHIQQVKAFPTQSFTESNAFANSDDFYSSLEFSKSSLLTQSDPHQLALNFTQSNEFKKPSSFSESSIFSKTDYFSPSNTH